VNRIVANAVLYVARGILVCVSLSYHAAAIIMAFVCALREKLSLCRPAIFARSPF
jgi:hypothetical protein